MEHFLTEKMCNGILISRCIAPEADWPVGQVGRMPEGSAARREKVRESMETIRVI